MGIKENKRRGKEWEENAASGDLFFGGWRSERTGTGSDFHQERTNILNSRKEERFVEMKSGEAKLSKRQKEFKEECEEKGVTFVERRQGKSRFF